MKHYWVLGLCLLFSNLSFSQDPVSWEFSARKLSDQKFEVRLKASIAEG